MKKWTLALLVVTAVGLTVAGLSFIAPAAQASAAPCHELPDCVGLCICEQHEQEAQCYAAYDAGLITAPVFRECMRQARQEALACFSDCPG